MKNLFLTLALLCCVSFAFANEGDKKESPKMQEKVEKQVVSLERSSLSIECFGLSCGTVCRELAPPVTDEDYDWAPEMYVRLWEYYEAKYCGKPNRMT